MNTSTTVQTNPVTTENVGTAINASPALYSKIAAQPFFSGLSARYLRTLTASAARIQFRATEKIVRKGDPADRLYMILRGKVLLEAMDDEGIVHYLQKLGPGGVFGWSCLVPPYQWHFDAVALEETEVISFCGTRLRADCEKDAKLGFEMMKRMAQVMLGRIEAACQKWIG